MPFLTDLRIIRPTHQHSQAAILDWIAKAHTQAAGEKLNSPFHEALQDRLSKIGLGKDKIEFRGMEMRDPFHENWDEMQIYNLHHHARGYGFKERMAFFDQSVERVFEMFYPLGRELPDHLIHVTCTGYVSPSGAQKIVGRRKNRTAISHAYHMGCYASIPAIRMAASFSQTDIVHTELCTLHMNPLLHEMEQLVVQSLFGDGFIAYSVVNKEVPGFEIISLQEEIIPNTETAMDWRCEEWGLRMKLSRDVPVQIARALPAFLEELKVENKQKAFFAIHPGGPNIIEQVAKVLNLEPWQYAPSKEILRKYGNMSSATLPHVWESLWKDPTVPHGAEVVSLAFGPGLTLAGGLFKCRRS